MAVIDTHHINNKPSLAISIRDVTHSYAKSDEKSDLFIPQWDLQLGRRVFLYGDSGSGKTTLLNLIAGVLTPNKGSIQLLGFPFSTLAARQRDKFRARHIGVVFQQFNLIPYLSVLKNIQLAGYFAAKHREPIDDFAHELLLKLNLPSNVIHKRASELSVGQQQRVAIARALINQPELLLVDEPTSALDESAKNAFMEILIETCQSANTTLVFVSHDMNLQDYFETSIAMPLLSQDREPV